MHRTHTCGELRASHTGTTVTLSGWVNDLRNMGGFGFVTLRDRYGVTQISTTAEIVASLHYEDCVKITGEVIARPAGQINDKMPTGEIEVNLTSIEVLGKAKELPFSIIDDPKTSEEIRMKHRYLDLRRRPVLDNVLYRARMNQFTRNRFSDAGFVEVQTPLFTVSSPEGARDYLIPSRVNPGQFYALPQAPQQYKQLLMIGGVDKYFQIAPCFRDEDPRADRHSCEFYQIDCEMSFVEQDDVHAVAESYINNLISSISDKTIISPIERLPWLQNILSPMPKINEKFPKIPYTLSMNLFGSDKPDLRFDCHMVNVTETFRNCEASFIADAIKNGSVLKAMRLPKTLCTRKEIDAITEVAKLAGAGGLPYIQLDESGLKGSIAKFVSDDMLDILKNKLDKFGNKLLGFSEGDTLFFFIGNQESVAKVGNKVRLDLRDRYNLVTSNELAFGWIINFPFFEMNYEGKIDFAHNPFSMVKGGVNTLINFMELMKIDPGVNPGDIVSEQYDMVCNGFEILSGSIRNHHPEVLVKAFEFVGKSEADVKAKFGAMYEAFQYGCPPHGGFAFGFDRLLMILKDEPNIREIYAFPKSGRAEDVMMGAPSFVDEVQLDELSLKVEVKG